MITVVDNFLPNDLLHVVYEEVKGCKLISLSEHKNSAKLGERGIDYPGLRSVPLKETNKILDSFLIKHLEGYGLPFTNKPYMYVQHAHLRVEKDNKADYIHIDGGMHFAWLLYLSKTNLKSGTKFYTDDEKETSFVRFIQNRFVIFDCNIKHMAVNNHGKDLNDGRLTVNGFASYNMEINDDNS